MSTQDLAGDIKVVLVAAGLLLAVSLAAFFLRRAIFGRREEAPGLSVDELKELERKRLLSEEEMKRVRQAMARQYVRRQEEEKARRQLLEGRSGIEALAIEAERLEAGAPPAAPKRGTEPRPAPLPAFPPEPPDLPLARLDQPPAPPPPSVSFDTYSVPGGALPPELENLAATPREQLEDLVNAGFLERADFERLLHARGEQP